LSWWNWIINKQYDGNRKSFEMNVGNGGGIHFSVYDANGVGFASAPAQAWTIKDDVWHHLAGTFDGSVVRMFQDGVEVGTAVVVPSGFEIGYGPLGESSISYLGSQWGPDWGFRGDLDDLIIWDRALTAEEIATRAGVPPCTFAVIAPADVTISVQDGSCAGQVSEALLGEAAVTRACPGASAVARSPLPPQNTFPRGVTTITYSATTSAGEILTATQTVTVLNAAPSISTPATVTVAEGGSVTLLADATDLDNGVASIHWDLDDDGDVDATGTSVAFSAVSLDDPAQVTVSALAGDYCEASASSRTVVVVANVPPLITSVTGPVAPVTIGAPVTISGTFSDPGILDTHDVEIVWGDGTATTATADSAQRSFAGLHTYASAGVYTVEITVSDDDGGSGSTLFSYVVVYDPEGGFVTGGGWFDSPPGAFIADPTISGKASFGFVSRYARGANIPTGNTEFQFNAAGFRFQSTSYDWLVVAGSKAMYKGSGTANGSGSYGFLLSAIDSGAGGGPDRLRVKVWRKIDGQIVYDNQGGVADEAEPSTLIGGGNIAIQR
jgi:hypothetical protein